MTEGSGQAFQYLEVRLREASCHGNHGGGERARDADGGQELGDVRREAKGNRAIGVQVARGVVDVEAEIRDVQLACILKTVNRESSCQHSYKTMRTFIIKRC